MKKTVLFFFFCVLFCSAQETTNNNNKITKIVLLRHAEKVKDGSKDPELSEEGLIRAERLSLMLSDFAIDKLYATNYIRTKKTLGIISEKKNISITNYNAKNTDFAKNLVKNELGKTVIIVGHSNTIPKLVNVLIGKDKYTDLPENEYGKLWVLTFLNEELVDCSLFNF